jgi:para-aminobenzoate synthetase component 1
MVAVGAAAVLAQLPVQRGCAVVRDGNRTIVCAAPQEVRVAHGRDAFTALDEAASRGFWAGFLAYDLGRAVERVRPRATDDLGLPDLALARFDARLVIPPEGEPEVHGGGPVSELLARAAWRARRSTEQIGIAAAPPWTTSLDRDEHARAVERVLELLRAGECYQVNLTRRLRAPGALDPVALYAALARENPAPHAALLHFGPHLPGVSVVSASPELFLRVDGRHVVTRPVKGTGRDAARLSASAKDRAENVMIVDLARNDLGRVCEYGSVQVPSLCAVEAHPGLYHLVSTVEGRLRGDASFGDLVRATFPPASVTGAPKPRVMQAIEDLEPVRRGVYCGAVGWVDGDAHRAELAVAIRTFTVAAGATHLGVGGGIVADSIAEAEWAETELKAARLLAAATGRGAGVEAR